MDFPMESSGNIVQFLEGKTIFVTGATGFLAKLLVEKILRIQPNVKKLFLLIRASGDAKSPANRLHDEVLGTELFKVLREKWGTKFNSLISEKVIPVDGDVGFEDLRVKDPTLKDEMWSLVDVIVSSAATTKFYERYDVAMDINVMGAMHVLNFAKRCTNLKMLLHVSTAYVSGERSGLILERPLRMGETLNGECCLDIDEEKKLVEKKINELRADKASGKEITIAMKNFGIQRARRYGWPNTYVFTKAMGEMVLGFYKEMLPLVIIRPTIIGSTYKEPFPGWIEGLRTFDRFAVAYGKGKLSCMVWDPKSMLDMIPGDMVVNFVLAAMFMNEKQPCEEIIYHFGSSVRNPIRIATLHDYTLQYFKKNPWIGDNGKVVRVGKITVLTDMASYQKYVARRFQVPLELLKLLNAILCRSLQGTYNELNRKINVGEQLVQLFLPYLFFKGIFDDVNAEKLRTTAGKYGLEDEEFCCNPKCIDWEDYIMHVHLPGVVKYLF